jgi:ribosomal protein S19
MPINIYQLLFKQYYKKYNLKLASKKRKIYFVKRRLFIFNFLINCRFYSYNGKKLFFLYLLPKHIFFKFGEFFFTKKRSMYLSKRKLKKKYRKTKKGGGMLKKKSTQSKKKK